MARRCMYSEVPEKLEQALPFPAEGTNPLHDMVSSAHDAILFGYSRKR